MKTEIINGLNSYLTFQLGEEKFAVNIGHVKKILEKSDVTKVPHVPKYYKGVINLFGDVLPVVCARQRFGMETIEYTETTCIIVLMLSLNEESFSIGFIVDQVHKVMEIADDQMQSPPGFGSQMKHEFIKSIANVKDEFVIILDVDKLFDASDLELINHDES